MARLKVIDSLEDIPSFGSEAEEAAFWDTHEMSDGLWESLPSADTELPPPRPRTRPVAVRFDQDTIERLKTVANRKHKGYQTLLKEFVMERLYEEEKREGLIA